jgi:hypothetical protein
VLLHLELRRRESYESCLAFLRGMQERGLKVPVLKYQIEPEEPWAHTPDSPSVYPLPFLPCRIPQKWADADVAIPDPRTVRAEGGVLQGDVPAAMG